MKRVLFLITYIFFLLGFILPQNVYAVETGAAPSKDFLSAPIGTAVDAGRQGELNGESYTFRLGETNMAATACMIYPWGPSKKGAADGLCTNSTELQNNLLPRSAVGGLTTLINSLYVNPPAHLATWVHDTGQSLGFIPKSAHAQGVGFSGMSSLLPIWKAFRNVAYLFMSLGIIVVGFMVMFRKKIDPKTVVTVQNALPKLVVTLLLITFSYAIVGFMIDLMYVIMFIAVGIFENSGALPSELSNFGKTVAANNGQLYTQSGLDQILGSIFGGLSGTGYTSFGNIPYWLLNIDPSLGQAGTAILEGGGLILWMFKQPFLAGLFAVVGGIPPLLALIMSLALLFLTIRLFIFFISAYIQIILSLIFAPLQIMLDVFPGSNSFESWIKNLFANIIVFPIASVIFMISASFASMAAQPKTNPMWIPPFIGSNQYAGQMVETLVAFGILFTIPSIAGALKEKLKAKPAVNAGLESVAGSFSQPISSMMQLYQLYASRETMKAFKKGSGIAGPQK